MTIATLPRKISEESVRELTDIQRQAAQLMVLGTAQNKIARALNLRESTISSYKALPEFQAELSVLREQARREFKEMQIGLAVLAGEALADLLVRAPADTRAKVAMFIYDRGISEPSDAARVPSEFGRALARGIKEALQQ